MCVINQLVPFPPSSRPLSSCCGPVANYFETAAVKEKVSVFCLCFSPLGKFERAFLYLLYLLLNLGNYYLSRIELSRESVQGLEDGGSGQIEKKKY